MSFERQTNAQTQAGRLSDAPWIADLDSLIYLEGGAAINLNGTDFPTGARSGTIVSVVAGEVKAYNGNGVTGLTRYDYDPTLRGVGSNKTMAVVVGGVVHLDKLPTMPTAAQVAKMPAIVGQNDSGAALSV